MVALNVLLCLNSAAAGAGGRSVTKKARTAAAKGDLDSDDDDLTADMDDPAPENPIAEVKLTAANAGRADMQPSRPGGSTLMDVDEAQEAAEGTGGHGGDAARTKDEMDGEDNVTEQVRPKAGNLK